MELFYILVSGNPKEFLITQEVTFQVQKMEKPTLKKLLIFWEMELSNFKPKKLLIFQEKTPKSEVGTKNLL